MLMHASLNNLTGIVPGVARAATNPFAPDAPTLGWVTAAAIWAAAVYFLADMPSRDESSTFGQSNQRAGHMTQAPMSEGPKVPRVGVGCIVVRAGHLLLVRNHGGYWSTPGGHLDFGETPAACAARETEEETGIRVSDIELVAITNDVFEERGKHYVTIWLCGRPDDAEAIIGDTDEIAELGWFDPAALPSPLHLYFENLLSGRCLPPRPQNLPFTREA